MKKSKEKWSFFFVCLVAIIAIVIMVKYAGPKQPVIIPVEEEDLGETAEEPGMYEEMPEEVEEETPEEAEEAALEQPPEEAAPCGPDNKGYCKLNIATCIEGYSNYIGSKNPCEGTDKSCCIPV